MTRGWRFALVWLLLSSGLFIIWGAVLERESPGDMVDFELLYEDARCLMQHRDPYQIAEIQRAFQAEKPEFRLDSSRSRSLRLAVLLCVNLPTALLLVTPFAMLPWGAAHLLWMALTALCLELAACLIWRLAAQWSPRLALLLVCIWLANCEVLFAGGNLSGIAISLSVIGVWCLLENRFVPAGILCLALSLASKPQEAGLVWLGLMLAGGQLRRRAIMSCAVTGALCAAAILWVSQGAPHWIAELRANLAASSAPGAINGPAADLSSGMGPHGFINLQSILVIVRGDPGFFNMASYLICTPAVLLWAWVTLRSRLSASGIWLALAAISCLTLLPVYHRMYDAKLILLTVPACAALWAKRGVAGWVAMLLTTAGFVMTGDIPTAVLAHFTEGLDVSATNFAGKVLMLLLGRNGALILLSMSALYLWVFVGRAWGREKVLQA